ncbi:transmembrane protein 82-like [Engraulis encrasicolus]|uniref:transmembrane protein 82-like n=1 Tax=Engraulis encrasicolus TaxID=184585 RepID=UPI002FCE860C
MVVSTIMTWLPLEDPLAAVLQGVVGACGVSLVYNLLRVCLFIHTTKQSPADGASEKQKDDTTSSIGHLSNGIQFALLVGLLSMVGPRLSCLIVLEFCLRVFLALLLFGQGSAREVTQQLLVQCQFSLGCSLTCTLHFLHAGAPHRCLSLLLAAALSYFLSSLARRLQSHVGQLFPQHCTQRECGVCLTLVSSGAALLPTLRRWVVMVFGVGIIAAVATMMEHFLLGADDLRFWTPMTVCYILLLLRMLEDQKSSPRGEVLLRSAGLRVGALFFLMMMVGGYTDMAQVVFFLLGEGVCLLPSLGLLHRKATQKEDDNCRRAKSE